MDNLTLQGVRRLVGFNKNEWEVIRHDKKRSIIVVRHLDMCSTVRRVMVYYTRNILSIVIRVSCKRSRFLYNNESDLEVFARLLESPANYKDLGFDDNCASATPTTPTSTSDECNDHCNSSESERSFSFITDDEDEDDLKARLEQINNRLIKLKTCRNRIKCLMNQAEKKKQKKKQKQNNRDNDDDDDDEKSTMMRSFVNQDVLTELHAINISQLVCLSLYPNGKGVIYTEKTGQCYWTCPISCDLGEILDKSNKKNYPLVINLGSGNRYFVRFSNGKQVAKATDELKEAICLDEVNMIAFGPSIDSYVVLYKDGGVAWSLIPSALRKALCSRTPDDAQLEFVSLGPNDAYFLRFNDDSVQYGNINDEMKCALDNCPGIIKQVTYGEGNCLIARYEPAS